MENVPTSAANREGLHVSIHNPLLDALFNNPRPQKSVLRNTLRELARNHSDFTVLVPPARVLHNCTDFSRQKLVDLSSSNEEFVRSHILRTSSAYSTSAPSQSKAPSLIFTTASGKQVLLKNGVVFSGKGFKTSVRLQILAVGSFVAFADYLPKNCHVSLIYIESSLYGPQSDQPGAANEIRASAKLSQIPSPANHQLHMHSPEIKFEELLRKFPVLSKTMSSKFYTLFHHNNPRYSNFRTRRKQPLSEIEASFASMVSEASRIVQDCVNADTTDGDRTYNLLHSISKQNPDLDMNRLINEYVELNIYDHVWSSLVFQYQDASPGDKIIDLESPKTVLTTSLYRDLSCLSLNQLDVPVTEPWTLNILQRRVADAIKIFSTLSSTTVANQRMKIDIIKNTITTLTEGTLHGAENGSKIRDGESSSTKRSALIIDADTLIGLLIMVIVHSKVPYLETHLFYVRHFGMSSILHNAKSSQSHNDDVGLLNYILSNIDAVILHLHDTGLPSSDNHLAEMIAASAHNYEFWYAIQTQNLSKLEELLNQVESEFGGKELPKTHFLRSKNINGESCLNFAVRSRNVAILTLLLESTDQWLFLEDILFDKNTSTNQNLLMVALQEEVPEVVQVLIDVLLSSTTLEEQRLYVNFRDANGRTVGHYLFHDLDALRALGHLVDWNIKDLNSHTPLFSMCRCYDHHDYKMLISLAFKFALESTSGIMTFEKHTDKAGNTLLHALARGITESQILSNERVLVNVNEMNHKGVTPAALYVRYNRLENLENIFRDPRLVFDLEEPKFYYNIMDYYSFSASKSTNGSNDKFSKIEHQVVAKYFNEYYSAQNEVGIGFLNAKYDSTSHDWAVNTAHIFQSQDLKFTSKYVPMDAVRQFYKLQQMMFPMTFFPNEQIFWANYPRGKSTVPVCSKYRINRTLEDLALLFSSMHYLRPETKKQLIKKFLQCCRDEKSSGLELIREITVLKENTKNAVKDFKLTEQKKQEMFFFVDFSRSDLQLYKSAISRLTKLAGLVSVKQSDLRSVTDDFFHNISGLRSAMLDTVVEFRRLDAPYLELQRYVAWIELCVEELVRKCDTVLQKLHRWEELYAKIKQINTELHKFEDRVIPQVSSEGYVGTNSTEGANSVPPDSPSSLSRHSTLSVEQIPENDEENESSFFNFGLVDSKKSRYRKLIASKAEEVKNLLDLNVEIKLDHEALAAELSQFMEYRSGVLMFGVKQFTKRNLISLRNRHYELCRMLVEKRRLAD